MLNKKIELLSTLFAGLLVTATPLHALEVTATYPEETVNFTTYDLGTGYVLFKGLDLINPQDIAPGTEITAYFQTFVTRHESPGGPVSAPGLDSGAYQLGVEGKLTEKVTWVSVPNVIEGVAATDLMGDFSLNYDNGVSPELEIMTGAIGSTGNAGFLTTDNMEGFSSLDIDITFTDPDFYGTGPKVVSGNGLFDLAVVDPTVVGVSNVLGKEIQAGDVLMSLNGEVDLQAIPIPAAVWLFGSALLGIVAFSRRQKV